jgi:hypothetical protein
MPPPSSSISSSETGDLHMAPSSLSSPDTPSRKRAWKMAAWIVFWVVVLDIVANLAFAYPDDPKDISPGRLQLYFDYGRSTEGRLRRATRADHAATAPITLSGWYDPLPIVQRPAKIGGHTITIYGMSHAVRLAEALQNSSPTWSVRTVAAPGATTNWAYGAFLRDKGRSDSQVAVLAIMTSTVPMIETMSAMTWNNSFAMPYTSDRFVVSNGTLKTIHPPYERFEDYVAVLNDPVRWAAAKRQFARNDPFYDPLLFDQTVLDHSTLIRLARRALGQRRDREIRATAMGEDGFRKDNPSVIVANAIISDFARQARKTGQIPVIYVVNSQGTGDVLYRSLADTLEREHIRYLSTHRVIDPNNPANYLPDSHFTDENDMRLAQALDAMLADIAAPKR